MGDEGPINRTGPLEETVLEHHSTDCQPQYSMVHLPVGNSNIQCSSCVVACLGLTRLKDQVSRIIKERSTH